MVQVAQQPLGEPPTADVRGTVVRRVEPTRACALVRDTVTYTGDVVRRSPRRFRRS
ncbi:hypothetical protein [Amycolatopsis taiwanensis]|uniref:hypothetical protein n=1 Tax=Amycolatopsis taiwanensis TaxID=342230 RepID=UPI0012EB83C6|nr:hypothetical protein [Amycolatopsis taiwanensis]